MFNRISLLFFVLAVSVFTVTAQDGSDMRYLKVAEVTKAEIGKFVHFDFGERSFGSAFSNTKRRIDRVTVNVDGKAIEFAEHREDDGFNNWFSRQFLESVARYDGKRLRIKYFELIDVSKNEFEAKAHFVYANRDGKELPDGAFSRVVTFNRGAIVEVLVKHKF